MFYKLMVLTQLTKTVLQFMEVTERQLTLFPTKECLVMLFPEAIDSSE
jgi:hypothetical protein